MHLVRAHSMMLFSSLLATALVARTSHAVRYKARSSTPRASRLPTPRSSASIPGPGLAPGACGSRDQDGRWRAVHLVSRSARRPAFLRLWSYRPGSAIAFTSSNTPSFDLALRKPQPKVVKLESPDGRPVPGAYFSLILNVDGRGGRDEVPEALATRLLHHHGAGRPGDAQLPGQQR